MDDLEDDNQRLPNEVETRKWIYEHVGDIMDRICHTLSWVPTAKTVARIPGTNKIPNG